MYSVGIDLAEISRIKESMKNPRFCIRVLGEAEFAQLQLRGFPVQSVAASFCAKEAFSKALGTGIRGFALTEVELLRDELGKPSLKLSGSALKIAEELGFQSFAVSVTHTREYASAVVIGEGKRDENSGL